MAPHIHITPDIRDIHGLFGLCGERFLADNIHHFSENLDSLAEIIDEYAYEVYVEDVAHLLRTFAISESRGYWKNSSDDERTLGETLLEIFHIPIPDYLDIHHEIGHLSGYKTRVYSAFFYELSDIDSLDQLHSIFLFAKKCNIEILVIGGGTNILFTKNYYPNIVIWNNLKGYEYNEITRFLQIASGESISEIARTLEEHYHTSIWHRFIGLPGTIGGAVVGNAGCFGLEAASNYESAQIYDIENNEIVTFDHDAMQFGYRDSRLKHTRQYLLISAKFDLSRVREKYASTEDNIEFREHRQPRGNSCGSFFKNPSRSVSAGNLIEQVGLKGYHHGGAYWSDVHANFLMSDGENCAPDDLIELVRLTQERVVSETGYTLENEVRIIE